MVVVGSQRMVQYDDTAADEPVRIYDRGIDFSRRRRTSASTSSPTAPATWSPRGSSRPSRSASSSQDFARAIRTGSEPRSNAQLGLEIVAAIEAAETSLRRSGEPVEIGERTRAAAPPPFERTLRPRRAA